MEDESPGQSPRRDARAEARPAGAPRASAGPAPVSRAALAAIARSNAGEQPGEARVGTGEAVGASASASAGAGAGAGAGGESLVIVNPGDLPPIQRMKEEESREQPGVDESEVYFLIADFLKRRSSCQKAADVLIAELAEHQLLRRSVDWRGEPKTETYEDYRLRHRDIAPTHLLELLQSATTTATKAATPRAKSPLSSKTSSARKTPEPASLLLKSRVSKSKYQSPLSETERKTLAKSIVTELFALRAVLKTQRVVEKVIKKYERLQQYTTVASVAQLPADLQALLLNSGTTAIKAEGEDEKPTDKVTALAADVRALKQLFQLRIERNSTEKRLEELMARAKRSKLFQTTARTGRNQMSLLPRREVEWQRESDLPPAYVYSRIRRLKTLNGHLQIQTYCLTYDKTGKFVITGADDRLIKIWSLRTGDLLFTLRGHVGNITDLAVNSSNTLLASSSDDKTVRVWELSTGAPVAVLVGHSSIVNSVRFHPKKNVVVTASDDGRCFCYKLPEIPRMDEPETKLQTAQRLFALKAYLLSLHPMYSLSHGGNRQGARSCKVLCLTFSRCGDFVVTGGQDGIARVWDMSVFSQPDAPAVVPRFQPTDAPQAHRPVDETSASEQPSVAPAAAVALPGVGAGAPSAVAVPPRAAESVAPPAPVAVTQGPRPVLAEMPIQQQPQEENEGAVLATGPRPALVLPEQAPGTEQTPDAAQLDQVQTPLPTVAQELERATQPQQSQIPQLPQSGLPSVAVRESDVPRLPNSEPIALLKGHTGPITNIVYSNLGDQIATASIKDGTTRIWRWKRKYKKMHGSVLFAKESAESDDMAAFYGVQTRKKAVPAVDTLMWTRNDKRLITLHSVKPSSHSVDSDWEQRIRVWDPSSGKLLMTLGAIDKEKKNGHVNAVFAMDVHPTDWRILVTAGYDGRVFLWDISTGRMLKTFTNLSPDSKVVPMLDGGFMPDGNGFCFTDQIGRLLIFGTGSGEQYAATPVQQYFHRDYAVLITDRHYNVRDRETQQLPSMMATGPLVDIYRIEYPHQPPHLLRNRALLTPELYEENRRLRVEQCKESEIKCRVRHLPEEEEEVHSFPLAIVKSGQGQSSLPQSGPSSDALALANASYRLSGAPVMLSELRRRSMGFGTHRRRREAPVERDTSVLELEISSDDDRSDEDFQVPTPRHLEAEEEEDEDDEDEDEEEMDEDDFLSDHEDAVISPSNFRRRRLRSSRQRQSPRSRFPTRGGRRLQSESQQPSEEDDTPRQLRARRSAARANSRLVIDSEGEEATDIQETTTAHGTEDEAQDEVSRNRERPSGEFAEQDGVVVESNDGFILGDNQLDKFDENLTYEQMLESKRLQLGTTRENMPTEDGEEALIPCAFCSVGDDGGMLKLPGDGMGVHPLIYGSQRIFVHDQCAIASPLCFNRSGQWYNVTKEIRRGRSLNCVGCNKRGATVGCTVTACRNSYHWKCAINCGWSMNQIQFFCPDHQSLRAQGDRQEDSPTAADGGASEEPVAKRFGLSFHREWLQLTSLRGLHQYVPQVGDYVVYLPEGHPGYLNYGGMRRPRYLARLAKFYAVKCRVVDVKYVFPLADEYLKCSTIKCEISLAVLAVPSSAVHSTRSQDNEEHKQADEEEMKESGPSDDGAGLSLFDPDTSSFTQFTSVDEELAPAASEQSTRFCFKVLYHSNDVANFLVLDHVYDSGVCGNWRVGDRVQMPYVQLDPHGLEIRSNMAHGVIEAVTPKAIAGSRASLSPWECVKVEFDSPDDETCFVSPWEIEPASVDKLREKRERSLGLRSTQLFCSRSIINEKCDALLQELSQIMTLSISRDFMYPVDESFLDYLITVANPIDLTKIQQRLRLGYYRQVEAFLADAKLLYVNCETYNVQTSTIAQNSRNLYSALLTQAQRQFPHLLRDESSENDAAGDAGTFEYPPGEFESNFPEVPQETQLELIDDGLLQTTAEFVSAPPTAPVNGAPAVVSANAASDSTARVEPVVVPQRSTRSLRRSEGGNAVHEEEKEEVLIDQRGVAEVETPPIQVSTTRAAAANSSVFSRPSSQDEGSARELRSPRVRRTPRVVTTPSSGGGSARKRQRTTPRLELLTYEGLLESLTLSQRDTVKHACDDDLSAVLLDFHEALMQADTTDIFAAPVTDDVAPQYSEIIKQPQDFGSMLDALETYRNFREYFDDVHLVFSNAITYNGWESHIGGLVQDLQKYCVKFLLDASGASRQSSKAHKTSASSFKAKSGRPVGRSPGSRSRVSPASNKHRTRKKAAAVILEEEEEESWDSSSSESEEDEEDEDEDEGASSAESDWGGSGRKRELRRPARGPKAKKTKRRH